MKSHFKIIGVLTFMTALVVFGCKNKVPTSSGVYPANPADRMTLVNFETPIMHASNTSVTDWGGVNANILGIAQGESVGTAMLLMGSGGFTSFFGWQADKNVTIVLCDSTNPSNGKCENHAAHIIEKFNNPGNSSYPSDQVRIRVQMSGCYDISNFKGVKFDLKYMKDDNAPRRRFAIAGSATLPTGDDITCGSCQLSQCRNNFGVNLSPSIDESWHTYSYSFTDLTQEAGFGIVNPPDFASHMKEVTWLQWEESRNNSVGNIQVDYWLDNVVFY